MSATIDTAVATDPNRNMLATRQLCDALGFGPMTPKELKNLSLALAESRQLRKSAAIPPCVSVS